MRVYVIDSENGSAPPPVRVSRVRGQVYEGFAGLHTAERGTIISVQQLESELPVEFDGTSHIADSEAHRADVLNHAKTSWSL
jgi:hypothetical protein